MTISMTIGVAVGRPGDGQHAVGGLRHDLRAEPHALPERLEGRGRPLGEANETHLLCLFI